jgi:hypothetical protein
MVKLKIEHKEEIWKSTFYMRDRSPAESEKPEMIGDNYLQIGQIGLGRLLPVFPENLFVENYLKAMDAEKPYLDVLNETTLYLRIPSFDISGKQGIDSVILTNKDKILKTENLIIDLRNNGGGSDYSFYELLPFLYTNPVRIIDWEFLSTKHNNQFFLDHINAEFLNESTRQWMKESYEKVHNRLGEFVRLDEEIVSISRRDTVYEYPNKIGIIINEGNASTTEQFLLTAKQSKKVKLFGITTLGAIDISNMNSIESPCKDFNLWYCLTRSLRIPDMTIDDVGLQPDFYLDKTIPQYKWVEFVNEILNEK